MPLKRIGKLKGKEREIAVEQLTILAGLRGLEQKVREEAKHMPFIIDLMDNKLVREGYDNGYRKAGFVSEDFEKWERTH